MNSVIVAAKRTAVAPRGGALSALSLHELAAPVVKACLAQCGIEPSQVDEIIVGNALGAGGNPARLVGLAAGLPESVAGLSLDRQCCSGLDALLIADALIRSGNARIVVVGGVESYSQRPHRFRTIPGSKDLQVYDQPAFTPWPDRDPDMAEAAQALAVSLGIDAQQQDDWAMESHQKARVSNQRLREEIVALNDLVSDPFTRDLSLRTCHRAKRIAGSISTANTAVAADAAGFCIVVADDLARTMKVPQVRIVGGQTLGANPDFPGSAPVAAMRQVMKARHVSAQELRFAEIMEAYAAQAIACMRLAEIDPAIVNVGGGALARGHPIGASGAILAVRLFTELTQTSGYGLAAIAAAGGLGTALLLEA
ncbi:thiolase family protein [Granulosicoccus antarcticus]|uniref:Acetyl-CoA C-acetyltransferase YhfS n=1 Tax=Granulosicoccus antarcticus IMCC3135 TaxID=1192854 RepID=A0A2Z2NHQ5_9GAMM|nr:thiolase family protein [Granulosicoccus antarcticus]ASJ70822.1 Putative acetyl-CoA C-acetyltransferase YhfS [Granulosicoccus antarcticus IMCC3135]